MTKVYAEDGPSLAAVPRTVRISTRSLIYTVGFILNLVLMPFKAYMSEPLPWNIQSPFLNYTSTDSFDSFTNKSASFLSAKYNHATLPASTIFARDLTANTYILRYAIQLPRNGDSSCAKYMQAFPGSGAYSEGVARSVCTFVAQNATARLASAQLACQHDMVSVFGVAVCCTWTELFDQEQDMYQVYHSSLLFEPPLFTWTKFGYRGCLSCFVGYIIWHKYYREFDPLMRNLRAIGLDDKYKRYVVQLGDPTWLVLSHPLVSLAMVLDILVNSVYGGAAIFRTSQLNDMFQFFLGSLYGSRTVWAAYLAMRYMTPVTKYMNWEHCFQPVDAGLLALTASIYAGPVFYFISHTPVVWVFQYIGALPVPAEKKAEQYDAAASTFAILLTMASVPIINSFVSQRLHEHRKKNAPPATGPQVKYAHGNFNDWKHRIMYRWHKQSTNVIEGGAIYQLFDEHPQTKKLPIFSARGSDCFVFCVDDAGVIERQVRLSLIHALDLSTKCRVLSICPACHTHRAVGGVDEMQCDDTVKASPTQKYRVHFGANNCRWI
ncbi:Aste57867_14116 [Aphanomyces stellatus]|uniref:Aste57867_14116 protein n=1 Tax=Aphanomyces stellatus TaxID=120398 RepID=A0A485KZY4_9STRA|nr:hypothetical protein As57867_014065 [Aphanomyces stellatus]VFT90943.1 Aste57867_14116 [Aphanomyces stellatus]